MVRAVIRVPYPLEDRTASGASFDGGSAGHNRIISKVPSLMFDMEDTEEATAAAAAGLDDSAEGDVAAELAAALEPCCDAAAMLLLHVHIAADEAAQRGAAHPDAAGLADRLRRLGYRVKLCAALGGGWGGACLRNLRHTFLAVALPAGPDGGGGGAIEVIVDPRFREQFEIAHATPRYARILAAVPSEVVAPRAALHRVVELLCGEMARAFYHTSTALPPWRQAAAMLSKWCPRRSEEVDVSKWCPAQAQVQAQRVDGVSAAQAVPAGGGRHSQQQHYVAAAASPGRAAGAPPPLRRQNSGGNTVAAKLAQLGVEPAQASPISEGFEDLDAWSSATDESGAMHTGSSGTSPAADNSPRVGRGIAMTATAADAAAKGRHPAWEGIRAAVAAMPTRRNTWA